tara:strand:- start:89 stop:466 length:378 start_codon:yes stop_codon:yes gene_type:complete
VTVGAGLITGGNESFFGAAVGFGVITGFGVAVGSEIALDSTVLAGVISIGVGEGVASAIDSTVTGGTVDTTGASGTSELGLVPPQLTIQTKNASIRTKYPLFDQLLYSITSPVYHVLKRRSYTNI